MGNGIPVIHSPVPFRHRGDRNVRSPFGLVIGATSLICSAVGLSTFVNAAPPQQGQDSRPLFFVKSELVMLNVTVRDKSRRYLDGLPQDAFTIFENEQQQPI